MKAIFRFPFNCGNRRMWLVGRRAAGKRGKRKIRNTLSNWQFFFRCDTGVRIVHGASVHDQNGMSNTVTEDRLRPRSRELGAATACMVSRAVELACVTANTNGRSVSCARSASRYGLDVVAEPAGRRDEGEA